MRNRSLLTFFMIFFLFLTPFLMDFHQPLVPVVEAQEEIIVPKPTQIGESWYDVFDYSAFWEEFGSLITWKATPRDDDLEILYDFPESKHCKMTINLTASLTAMYTINFKIDQEFVEWEVRDETSIILFYDDYTLVFDFSDVEDMNLQHSHSTTGKKFIFLIQIFMEAGENLFVDPSLIVMADTPDPAEGTTHAFQRKTFYDEGRYWAFFSSGREIQYRSSTDGNTW